MAIKCENTGQGCGEIGNRRRKNRVRKIELLARFKRLRFPELTRSGTGHVALPTRTRADLTFLKWLTILAPLIFVVVLQVLLHTVLNRFHDPPGVILVFALVAVGVAFFSFIIFGMIGRLEAHILEQNELLTTTNQIASASAANPELEKLLQVTLERVLEVTGAAAGLIYTVDPEIESSAATCQRGFTQELALKIQEQELEARVIDGQSSKVSHIPVVDLFKNDDVADLARKDGFQSGVAVLLDSKETDHAVDCGYGYCSCCWCSTFCLWIRRRRLHIHNFYFFDFVSR